MTGIRIGRRHAAAIMAGICGTVASAQAQVAPESITVHGERLEESLPMDLAQYGNRLEIITAGQIDELGFNDTGQILQALVPGLYLAPRSGAFDYVEASLQGSRQNEILWLIDGVRISNRLYNATTPLDTVPAHMIERIEVLKGGQGLFYGTQAVAGVVNVVTKSFSTATEGALEIGVDTNDGRHLSGFARGSSGPHQFVIYGSSDEADGFQPFRDADYQPSATDRKRGYDVTTFGTKYGVDLSDALRFSLTYQHTEAQLDNAAAEDIQTAYNKRDEDLVSGKLDITPGDTVALFLKGYYHDWDTHYTRLETDLDNPGELIVSSDAEFWGFFDYGANILSQFNIQRGVEYLLGYDFQRYGGRDEVFLIADKTEHVHAFFGQVRSTEDLLENTRLAAGVRHNIAKGDDTTTVWNVSGRHDFTDALFARAVAGTSFRLPDAYELYVVDPCCEQGNPDLVGEKSRNFELGIGGQVDLARGVRWEAIGFYREIDNLIKIVPRGDGVNTLANTDDTVKMRGGELVITAALTETVSLTFDYTHTKAEESGSDDQITGVPEDLVKLLLNYRPESLPIGLSLSLNYVGQVWDMPSGGIGRVAYGKYLVTDLAGFWYLDSGERHRLSFRLENALNEDYATSIRRVDTDDTPVTSYPAGTRGTPRTLHVRYGLRF